MRAERSFLERALYSDSPTYYEYAGNQYEVVSLTGLLGAGQPALEEGRALAPLVLVRAGEHSVALHVDGLLGSREIVVKSVGPQISAVPGTVRRHHPGRRSRGAHPRRVRAGAFRRHRGRGRGGGRRARSAGGRRSTADRRPSWWSTTPSPCARSPRACSSATT
ncbi:MAG: chemotaxis protein CheW [Arhodomonas sp.]|nr:chemotaxis protein CheW [Arhodomonas sp.]